MSALCLACKMHDDPPPNLPAPLSVAYVNAVSECVVLGAPNIIASLCEHHRAEVVEHVSMLQEGMQARDVS